MIESFALDALLVLVLILLVPIGLYRGGLSEVCSAAGLLLGFLVADAWSERWGSWLADRSGIDGGVSRFGVAMLTIVVVTAAVGYGAGAAFSSRPGPGGRLYGGLIALCTGVVFLGATIDFVRRYLHDGELPAIVRNGYVSRALSTGFDWVLLLVTASVMAATVFGMFVRERDTGEFAFDVPVQPAPQRRGSTISAQPQESDRAEPPAALRPELAPETAAAVRIKEVRHWEDHAPPTPADLQTGWTQTWPAIDREPTIKGHRVAGRHRVNSSRRGAGNPSTTDDDVLRSWLEQEQGSTTGPPGRKPQSDE